MENIVYMEERQREIADIIAREGKISNARIQGMYMISYETVRRDLEQLEKSGLCKRTHGGAIAPLPDSGQVSVRPPVNRDFASMPIFPEYLAIARKASEYISKNDCIYLTGGSLGHLMLKFLPTDFFYTVVVNSADMAEGLRAFGNFDVYIIGGKMRQSGSIVDATALENVSRFRFDTCFITGGGLSTDFGLSNGTGETAAFQREVIKNSKKKILLMPGKKVGHDCFVNVCSIKEFSEIITDWTADPKLLDEITSLDISVVTAEEEK
ncbi:MAG: DeoR/GlpR transcriptional regulator [Oscillospiraceae bacterium]|nr:DeoR/GlpR transcriptional regulator [Oscillospiraceae bacterium]